MADDIPELIDPEAEAKPPLVPVSILTGFLGAGKSTLLQYILNAQHGYRIAVIMNEFSDSADLESRTINVTSEDNPNERSEEILELANGCLCCSIKDSGIASIEKLLKRRGFDYILLETTGMADPGPIASMFWDNEGMSDSLYLDGVICVVDGVFGLAARSSIDSVTGARQIACADMILLNKIDIASPESLSSLEVHITSINNTAPIIRTARGQVDLSRILNLNAYTSSTALDRAIFKADDHQHEEGEEHDHFGGITSLIIPLPPLSTSQAAKLDEWLRTLLWEGQIVAPKPRDDVLADFKSEILRCKGLYTVTGKHDTTKTFVIQGVRTLYDVQELNSPDPSQSNTSESTAGKLVLIGILQEGLKESLFQALGEKHV